MKKLSREIDGLKRKYDDTSRAMLRNRAENENLIKNMKNNIENLKSEKTRLVKQLKSESDRVRQLKSKNDREVANLKRKEKAASEVAKRLERNNQLQVYCLSFYFILFYFV